MTEIQKFRKAVNGFNRHDVVTYIEYLNNKHRGEITQLENRLQAATRPIANPELEQQHSELQQAHEALKQQASALEAEKLALAQECEQLRTQIAALQLKPETTTPEPSFTEQELEAYRRAERAERLAIDRARQINQQAKGILADATAKVQISATQLEEAAKNMTAHMEAYKSAVMAAGNILNDTAASLGTVCPEE